MLNLCFDTEFTHLKDPLPPAQLLSIGVAGMYGERFYAENSEVGMRVLLHMHRELRTIRLTMHSTPHITPS
jgi:hypothetical protein